MTEPNEKIELIPTGCQTPEGQARVKAAVDVLDRCNADSALALNRLLQVLQRRLDARKTDSEVRTAILDAQELDEARREAYDAFVMALIGRR